MTEEKIRMPRKIITPLHYKKNAKFRYLLLGFEKLGIPVVKSQRLNPACVESRPYPFNVVYGKGDERRIYLDVAASKIRKHPELIKQGTYYFKTHLALEDHGRFDRVFPMPQATSNLKILREIPALRNSWQRKRHKYDIVAIFVNSDGGIRQKVVEIIRTQEKWRSQAWMIRHPRLERPEIPEELVAEKLSYVDHLYTQSRSLLNLGLTGAMKNHGASCSFRHVEIWAMGSCLVTTKPETVFVGNPKNCWIEIKDDLSDFISTINSAIRNKKLCRKIAQNGKEYFDKYLTPEAHVIHILRTIQEHESR